MNTKKGKLKGRARACIERLRWPFKVSVALGAVCSVGLTVAFNVFFYWIFDEAEFARMFDMYMFPLMVLLLAGMYILAMLACLILCYIILGICRLCDRHVVMKEYAPAPSSGDTVLSMVLMAAFINLPPIPLILLYSCIRYGFSVLTRTAVCLGICIVLSALLLINTLPILIAPAAIISEVGLSRWKKKHPETVENDVQKQTVTVQDNVTESKPLY